MIEMETGLPIGHHCMACDYAPAGGIATWDLADAALEFHDRNCVNCTKREPVRLPNLSSLLQERDAQRRHVADEKRAQDDRTTALREARRLARQSLRTQLDALSATIVDHLEELDQDASSDAGERLFGLAQLAPETFTPAIVEHFFCQLEIREWWFDETGLRILDMLQVDLTRLTRCALRSLGEHRSIGLAASIVETNNALIDESLVASALPALVDLACPERLPGFGFEQKHVPGPLINMYRARRAATEAAIGNLLDQRDPYLVSVGARAIRVLAQEHKAIASYFTRSLVAKLARAQLLMDSRETGYRGDDEAIGCLQDAVVLALEYSPDETDAMMAQFIEGASSEGEVRIYKVYNQVLRGRRFRDDSRPILKGVAKVALMRLIGAATASTNKKVLQEMQGAFNYVGEEFYTLARDELTTILGAAILLDDRVKQFDAEPATDKGFLASLERKNHRDLLLNLQCGLVKWAASASSGYESATTQYIEVLAGIPESQDTLRSVMIENARELMNMPDGLNAVLPTLYTAMVGASNRERAAAATAIGKLNRHRREDVPELLYEAFTSLLADPYLIVHYAALETLEHLALPEELDLRAKVALGRLIDCYAISHSDDRFLLRCIELYLRRYTTDQEKRGGVGKLFVALLDGMKAEVVAERLGWFRRDLRETEGFDALVIRILTDQELTNYRQEHVLRALDDLPFPAIHANKLQLEAIAVAPNVDRSLPAHLVETLTRAGAWEEAARINEAIYSKIPDTVEKHAQKLAANLDRIATKYEEAIALGKINVLPELAKEWRVTEKVIEENRRKHAERGSPFAGFPGAY